MSRLSGRRCSTASSTMSSACRGARPGVVSNHHVGPSSRSSCSSWRVPNADLRPAFASLCRPRRCAVRLLAFGTLRSVLSAPRLWLVHSVRRGGSRRQPALRPCGALTCCARSEVRDEAECRVFPARETHGAPLPHVRQGDPFPPGGRVARHGCCPRTVRFLPISGPSGRRSRAGGGRGMTFLLPGYTLGTLWGVETARMHRVGARVLTGDRGRTRPGHR